MRLLASVAIGSALLIFTACDKPVRQADAPPPTPPPATPVPATSTPAPAAPTPELAPSALPQKRLAPAGTYYVVQPLSFTTDDGVFGIQPGTKVTLVKEEGSSLRVSNGTREFTVSAAQVTNDLDVVGRLVGQMNATAAAVRQAQAQSAEQMAANRAQKQGIAAQVQAANQAELLKKPKHRTARYAKAGADPTHGTDSPSECGGGSV